MTELFENRFFGILTGVNTSVTNENLIKKIIEINIYIQTEKRENDRRIEKLDSFKNFSNSFFYNEKNYTRNPKIAIEIYNFYKIQSTIFEIQSKAYFRNSIEINLKRITDYNDALKWLQNQQRKLLTKSIKYIFKVKENASLFDSTNEKTENFQSLFNFILSDTEVENYLTLKVLKIDGDILRKWKKFIYQKVCLDYYDLKIIEFKKLLENKTKIAIENSPFNELIFKNNAEELFTFIVTKYPYKKNTAFFSYLFFYFKDDVKLLRITGNDNLIYRKFIIQTFDISFARIQVANSSNQFKKMENLKLFETYKNEYYSLKFESNLSNNE